MRTWSWHAPWAEQFTPRAWACLALLECCEWIALVFMDLAGNRISLVFLVVVLAANSFRTLLAFKVPDIVRHVEVPVARLWLLIHLPIIVMTSVVQCSALVIVIACFNVQQAGEGSGCAVRPSLCGGEEVLYVADLWIMVSIMSSLAWYYCCLFWRQLTAHPPPKPRVDRFVVRDVISRASGLDSACAICLDDFSPDCIAARLPCSHVFHDQCFRGWLRMGRPELWCPMRCPIDASPSPNGPPVPTVSPTASRPSGYGHPPRLAWT